MPDGSDGPVPQRYLSSLRAPTDGPRNELAKVIPRRPRVSWWLGIVFAFGFVLLVAPTITADRWLAAMGVGEVHAKQPATMTIRVPVFRGYDTEDRHIGKGGYVIARGQVANTDDAVNAASLRAAQPKGALPYV